MKTHDFLYLFSARLNRSFSLSLSHRKSFNRVQSRVFEATFKTADNVLMCAPTGAGKTNVAMLTIMNQVIIIQNVYYARFFKKDFVNCLF